jgi:hypothetical protein
MMDADLQHDERLVPQMLAMLESDGADLVVGIRYVTGGGIDNWDRGPRSNEWVRYARGKPVAPHRGDRAAAKLQQQTTVEIQPQIALVRFTRRVLHRRPI